MVARGFSAHRPIVGTRFAGVFCERRERRRVLGILGVRIFLRCRGACRKVGCDASGWAEHESIVSAVQSERDRSRSVQPGVQGRTRSLGRLQHQRHRLEHRSAGTRCNGRGSMLVLGRWDHVPGEGVYRQRAGREDPETNERPGAEKAAAAEHGVPNAGSWPSGIWSSDAEPVTPGNWNRHRSRWHSASLPCYSQCRHLGSVIA